MIKAVTVTNPKNESLRLELTKPEESGLAVINVTGLGEGPADISMTDMATTDGSYFNLARLRSRNIVFTLKPLADPSVETNRHRAYRYFPIKKKVTLLFETDERESTIEGYVETNEAEIFSNFETIQISIMCPDPCFYSAGGSAQVFSGVEPLFEFPFSDESIQSPGDTPYYENQLVNSIFSKAKNDATLDNDNLTTNSNFRLYPGGVPEGYTNNSWAYVNESNGTGTVLLMSQGLVLNRPSSSPSGITRFVYCIPFSEFVGGDSYTFSFLLEQYGLITTTLKINLDTTNSTLSRITIATGKYMEIYNDATNKRIRFGVYVNSGYSLTMLSAKAEAGTVQTLVSRTSQTSWHMIGRTINDWYVTSGTYGLFRVDLESDTLDIRIYEAISQAFVLSQDVYVRRGETMTISALTLNNLYAGSFSIPNDGEFRSNPVTLEQGFMIRLYLPANSNVAQFQIYRTLDTPITNSVLIQLRAFKLEYSKTQTLATYKNNIWVINTQPTGMKQLAGTIEFGNILLDTRAILYYQGDVDTGLTITVHAVGAADNITLYNVGTGEQMRIDTAKIRSISGRTFDAGDDIIVSTKIGQKSLRLLREGVYTNIIGALDRDSDWFQLTPGDNIFVFDAESGANNLMVTFSYRAAYGGI